MSYVLEQALEQFIIDHMEHDDEITAKIQLDVELQSMISEHLRRKVYDGIPNENDPIRCFFPTDGRSDSL